jgi:hypothetical protein
VAYHIRTTNEPRKKTHRLNVEGIATHVSGKTRIWIFRV